MGDIKFGTDGWRAIIGRQFTVENVRRVSQGVAFYMADHNMDSVVIGHDTRFGGQMFCREAASVLASNGIRVYMHSHFVTTPMISTAVRELNTGLGIVITASHNPPLYNGYKIKESFGGPAGDTVLRQIESLIPDDPVKIDPGFEEGIENGLIIDYDLEELYYNKIAQQFDLENLKKIASNMAYDSMYGAGSRMVKRLFPKAIHLHDLPNPGFMGKPPEPIGKNLKELMECVRTNPNISFGMANDGDADRIGLVDEGGNFIDAHHIMLLTLYYLVEVKKLAGPVIISAATTEKVVKLATLYGLEHEFTKIGFKHITPRFIERGAIMGGEEAGGVAVAGHIPERDGIWIALIIMELMAESGQTLGELIQMMYQKLGPFVYDRIDLHLNEEKKEMIVEQCKNDAFSQIAGYDIIKRVLTDGYKYYLGEATWIMIRPSGTEPVLRIYAQAETKEELQDLLQKSKTFLLN